MPQFTYPLTDSQYNRFQHPTNTQELNTLGKLVNTRVAMTEKDRWTFEGWFAGTAAIERFSNSYWLWIKIDRKPWWCPKWLMDAAFRKSLV